MDPVFQKQCDPDENGEPDHEQPPKDPKMPETKMQMHSSYLVQRTRREPFWWSAENAPKAVLKLGKDGSLKGKTG